MLSIREKLLQRPWLEKKYIIHRRKVSSALPAIDNRPPETRKHVAVKQKKIQKENERCSRIEKDNLLLLKKLCWIMKSNRVDNWNEPLPNFLSRVSIYDINRPQSTKVIKTVDQSKSQKEFGGENIKCYACAPNKPIKTVKIPEERVPWKPPKLPLSLKFRSQSVPPQKRQSLPTVYKEKRTVTEKRVSKSAPVVRKQEADFPVKVSLKKKLQKVQRSQKEIEEEGDGGAGKDLPAATLSESEERILISAKSKVNSKMKKSFENECVTKYMNSIVLSRGSLVLSVNFPLGTSVKLKDGNKEKLLMKRSCSCKNDTKIC